MKQPAVRPIKIYHVGGNTTSSGHPDRIGQRHLGLRASPQAHSIREGGCVEGETVRVSAIEELASTIGPNGLMRPHSCSIETIWAVSQSPCRSTEMGGASNPSIRVLPNRKVFGIPSAAKPIV